MYLPIGDRRGNGAAEAKRNRINAQEELEPTHWFFRTPPRPLRILCALYVKRGLSDSSEAIHEPPQSMHGKQQRHLIRHRKTTA